MAFSQLTTANHSPAGDHVDMTLGELNDQKSNEVLNLDDPSTISIDNGSDAYISLQLRVYRLALVLTAFAVLVAAFFFGLKISFSLMIGAFSGILYLRLLARGIGKLGESSKNLSKVQLLVPVVLVLVVSRLPQLDLLPALAGFLLYKPSLIIQYLRQS